MLLLTAQMLNSLVATGMRTSEVDHIGFQILQPKDNFIGQDIKSVIHIIPPPPIINK